MLKIGIVWYLLLAFHPVHVSLSSLEYDEKENLFRLFVKVYSDDLEGDCRLMTGDPGLLLYENASGPDKKLIQDYINGKIEVEINNKVLKGEITAIDYSDEEVRINATYKFKGKARSIRILNKVMTDLFSDQANLFVVRIGEWEEGVKFTPENTEIIINR